MVMRISQGKPYRIELTDTGGSTVGHIRARVSDLASDDDFTTGQGETRRLTRRFEFRPVSLGQDVTVDYTMRFGGDSYAVVSVEREPYKWTAQAVLQV